MALNQRRNADYPLPPFDADAAAVFLPGDGQAQFLGCSPHYEEPRGKRLCYWPAPGFMIATLTAYDQANSIVYQATREYPDSFLLWEHVGCQQNNQRTVRVLVETESGVEYEVRFSPWTPNRLFAPSRRFHDLLRTWGAQFS